MTSTVLPTPGAAEHRRLAALRERRQQVDHLDAGREDVASCRSAMQAAAGCGESAGAAHRRQRARPGRPARRSRRAAGRARASPTGTAIGPPDACTGAPRRNPWSTARRARAPCVSSRCACTSATIGGPSSVTIESAASISGKLPVSNATSTTAPRTAVTRPAGSGVAAGWAGRGASRESVSTSVMPPRQSGRSANGYPWASFKSFVRALQRRGRANASAFSV